MSLKLSRRTVLRGLGGAALALPALEVMGSHARADGHLIPKRYLICFGGSSLGWSYDLFAPSTVGANYDCKLALKPLQDLAVTDRVSVVSGMEIPAGELGQIPPGGRYSNFHGYCFGPLFSGARPGVHTNGLPFPVNAPSSDQIVADAISASSKVRCMAYRVQAAHYGDTVRADAMSYRLANGQLQKVQPKVSPALIFGELFDGYVAPSADPAVQQAAQQAAELHKQRRLSVLDLVSDKTAKLMSQLGSADQIRMQQHLDQIRELEKRVDAISVGTTPGGGSATEVCGGATLPADPATGATYSNEEQRAELICDLIHLAFTCDLSRAGSLMFTEAQCGMNMEFITGYAKSLHDVGHSESLEDISLCVAWHVKHFARLVAKLRDTQEVDGSSLLDHCALSLVFEGGWGYDPQTNEQNRIHSTQNMSALVAGGAGGLVQGQHIPAPGRSPVELINTTMHAVGVTTGFNEVSGVLSGVLS